METNKKRGIYWLVDNLLPEHRIKAMLLAKRGFNCLFFATLDTLREQVLKQRVSIIIIDDSLGREHTEKAIQYLLATPEVQGARLILSATVEDHSLFKSAACSAFRDIIPLHLDNRQWLIRFVFATASHKLDIPKPTLDIGISQICNFSVPGRVVWISEDRMLIEAKCRPHKGSTLNLTGSFATSLGLRSIPVKIEEHRHTDLVYRFSDAMLVTWSIPQSARTKADELLTKMRQNNSGPRCKVFLAMQNPELRSAFSKNLDPTRFEVNIALQKQSIVNEPKYFSPQIVFFEDRLCLDDNFARFQQMLEGIKPEVPVYIVGNRVQLKQVQGFAANRKVGVIPSMPRRLTEMIFSKLLPTIQRHSFEAHELAVHLSADHPFSAAEIQTSGRILKIHPTTVQIASPIKFGTFGLLRLESPVLKKFIGDHTFSKIYNSFEDYSEVGGTYHYIADCFLATLTSERQKKFATELGRYVADQLQIRELTADKTPVAVTGYAVAQVNAGAASAAAPHARGEEATADVQTAKAAKSETAAANTSTDVNEYSPMAFLQTGANALKDVVSQLRTFVFSSNFRLSLIFMSAVFATFLVLWFVVNFVAPYWHKSGGTYTDSLKKFAPDKFTPEKIDTEEAH